MKSTYLAKLFPSDRFQRNANRSQGVVEFALSLPILSNAAVWDHRLFTIILGMAPDPEHVPPGCPIRRDGGIQRCLLYRRMHH